MSAVFLSQNETDKHLNVVYDRRMKAIINLNTIEKNRIIETVFIRLPRRRKVNSIGTLDTQRGNATIKIQADLRISFVYM